MTGEPSLLVAYAQLALQPRHPDHRSCFHKMSKQRNDEHPLTETSFLLGEHPNAVFAAEDRKTLATRAINELREQLETALPTLQSMVLTKIPWLISLRFVGEFGAPQLAAAALATTLFNVTGISLSVGLSSALSTLSGQAKGELVSRSVHSHSQGGNRTMDEMEASGHKDNAIGTNDEPITPIVFFLRGMVVQLAVVIPVFLWWMVGVESVLISLGQEERLSHMTSTYLKVLAPGLLGYSINWTMTAWLQSIGMANVPANAAVLGLVLHVPCNWFFIYFLDSGYLGCGAATVFFNLVQPIFVVTAVLLRPSGREQLLEASGGAAIGRSSLTFSNEFVAAVSSIRGYVQYLALALPGIVIISEWWASETAIFLSGRLVPDPQMAVGGLAIYQSINSFCFMFPIAFSIAASTRVSNLLGAGKAQKAAFAGYTSVSIAACLSLCLGILLLVTPHSFLPSLFAPDAEGVILETSRTIPLLAIYVFADGIQCALNGIIKGCGKQALTMPIVVVAYWLVGLPLGYYIAFVRHSRQMYCDSSYFCGIVGLVAGMTAGTW